MKYDSIISRRHQPSCRDSISKDQNTPNRVDIHFTFRAVVCGLCIGTLMCFSNMYFGLQTGWISMMSLQSSLLGFAIFKPFQHLLKHKFGPIENVVLQTTAVATATMPLAAGFVGVIPAMEIMTQEDNPSGPVILNGRQLILWSLGIAFFGVFFAIPLRKQTIIREKLNFPSGTATAQMISILHQQPDPTSTITTATTTTTSLTTRTDITTGQSKKRMSTMTRKNHVASQSANKHRIMNSEEQPLLARQRQQEEQPTMDDAHFEQSWTIKLRGLVLSFTISSLYTLLSYFVPTIYYMPIFNWITFGWVDFQAWEWTLTPSFSYVGQGIIMGLPTTLSMLLGCIIGWGILSPMAYYLGWAPGPVNDWKTGSKGWILWISLGVMIADACISLCLVLVKMMIQTYYRRKRHQETLFFDHVQEEEEEAEGSLFVEETEVDAPTNQLVPKKITMLGLLTTTFTCIFFVRLVFGPDVLPIGMTLLAVLVAMFLSVLGVRALGETDLNPVSGIGKISQVFFAAVMPGGILANLIAGGIAEAGAQQAGDLMQDLKTGHLLGASPKAQFYGQMIGSLASVFLATGFYLLFRTVYTLPGREFPVPTAQVWLDMSRLVNGHPLPPHVTEFVFGFAILFTVLVILKELGQSHPLYARKYQKWTKYIPQGIAFAIGMYNPPNFTLARVMGGVVVHYWNKYCEQGDDESEAKSCTGRIRSWLEPYRKLGGKVFIIVIASGFVLGEGTFALVKMTLSALGVPHL
ncbi:OPT oligopeptide transporter protein-domain-containing protein [Mycotypha africana]|uniref:OPT oligopeptide transporter protein-domain-containing protein n=1 Tax=Mycotypha africana TaxID=64632 RepID=UPI0023006276|nr:OPT oligopeptide transporter protein-domain-containing protein [Mycotypha africana]KAI8984298.1 OPT oligopeptide transporter protein-domain-containing protein [Mycotypha africana]